MEGSEPLRKTCDFCYRRKIKCNREKPRCSHCVTYMTVCTYSAPSRKSRSKKPRSSPTISNGNINTQDRLRQLETLLQQLTERVNVAERLNESQDQSQLRKEQPIDIAKLPTITTGEGHDGRHDSNPESMFIPPLQHILPTIQIFLEEFNAVLPLFCAKTLLRLIHNFYRLDPQQRDPVAWAAINVVIALTYRQGLVSGGNTDCSVEYLSRAESVVSAIVLGDIQLLNIQVLVGMVILLQASQEHQASMILIATTMRLAHKIGLHNRASSAHLDPAEANQRAYVFWMAYILDKDLSMRSKQPSIQLDDDIDLDLPSSVIAEYKIDDRCQIDDASTGTGIVTTLDETVKMNYFVARIQLAVIEGGVYDYVYSTRSQKRSTEERLRALESVACALEKWKASIPPEFSASMALGRVSPGTLRFLAVLHSTSLTCITLLNQANAWNSQWVGSIRTYAREGTIPPLPPQWEALVDDARDLVVLFGALPVPDRWDFWITGCSYMTAIMLLKANSMLRSQYDKVSLDRQLVEDGLQAFDRIVEETKNDIVRSFRDTCAEINREVERRRVGSIIMVNNASSSLYFEDS